MVIECDTRQQKDEHIVKSFDEAGIKYVRTKLYCGDYKRADGVKVIIDTKKDLLEISNNLCRTIEHRRIKQEIAKACDLEAERFIFLIADNTITNVSLVHTWNIPKKRDGQPYTRVKPETLQKIMETMEKKYGVEFMFCKKKDMGKKIIELLGGDESVR